MNATFSFTVNSKQAGTLLLSSLLPAIPYLSAEQWQALLSGTQGYIQIDGQRVCDNVVLVSGQQIRYTINNYQEAEVNDAWSTIWSNDEIAAIHKPANLPVNRTTRNVYNTLIQLLRRESPWPDAHLLHRLDLETSGVMLIAHNNRYARQYQSTLERIIKRKVYRAVVYGKPCWQKKDFICDLAAINSRHAADAVQAIIRCQMHVVPEGKGKESRTQFNVLNHNLHHKREASDVDFSLIECEILTGRKHQIRAQLAHLGHPIVGDKIYSKGGEFYLKRLNNALSTEDYKALLAPHHLLHAYEIHLNNIWQPDGDDIVVRDDDFPDAWQAFDY